MFTIQRVLNHAQILEYKIKKKISNLYNSMYQPDSHWDVHPYTQKLSRYKSGL